ncbi:MAG: 16S rRNA (adenine(1518)-N(6)/adenine(1519)-N(6))-dimethyltransferase RsmA [candidate division WOR-3 bacterium]
MRRLSQVFLRDRTYIERMIQELSPKPGELFLEVGPGQGALTRPLIERGARVVAVELDIILAESLKKGLGTIAGENLTVIQGNYLRLQIRPILPRVPVRFISNLPYHISTPAMEKLSEEAELYEDAHITLQKEFADRLLAKPGTKEYGYTTVLVRLAYDPELLFYIPPAAFSPMPRVMSVFMRLRKRKTCTPADLMERASKIAWASFRFRRRAIKNSLKPLLRGGTLEILNTARIDPEKRADQLCPEEYLEIAKAEASFLGLR